MQEILNIGDMTTAEVKEIKAPAYSSVMDYAASDYNELSSFGKYDVAALQNSYGKKVDFPTFRYCTDQNAGGSTTCNRFDEGTDEVEIAKHKILRYKNYYNYRNYRNGKEEFSTNGIGGYIVARYNEFGNIRNSVEDFEFFMTFFGKETMENGCSKEQETQWAANEYCSWIASRRQAVLETADFFLEILKTPDHTCALAAVDKPTEVIALVDLKMLFERSGTSKEIITTCFDADVQKFLATGAGSTPLVAIGETGKYLNSFKGNDSKHTYSSDITVRGIWVDKIMAMRSLYQRTSRSEANDEDHYALIDHPLVKAKVQNYIDHLTSGVLLDSPNAFTNEKGQKFYLPYVLSGDATADQMSNQVAFGLKMALGLPLEGDVKINKAILAQVNTVSSSYDSEVKDTVEEGVNYVSVLRFDALSNINLNAPGIASLSLGDELYIARKEHVIANNLIEKIAPIKELVDFVNSVEKEKVIAVIKHRTTPPAPATLTPAEVTYFNLEEGFQLAIINILAQDVPVEAFSQAFGEEDGPILHVLYLASKADEGAKLKEIVASKKTIAITPYEGASEKEVVLFSLPLEFLSSVVEGNENELQKYYTERLEELMVN
jgi:hypothetical protein